MTGFTLKTEAHEESMNICGFFKLKQLLFTMYKKKNNTNKIERGKEEGAGENKI